MSATPQLSKAPGAQPTERRRSRRRPLVDEQIVTVTLDRDNGGLMLDLGEEGVAVQAVTPLQAGKPAEMAFVLPDSRVAIRATGIVRWAEPAGRAGIRLLAFSQGSAADIRAAVLQAPAAPGRSAERSARPLDARLLEREIEARKLDQPSALEFLAQRVRELVSASGAAIALGSPQEMICRASAGAAPGVGVRLQSEAGLSGECVRTGVLVRCDDTQSDARVDPEVCRQLDLRSAVLVPIRVGGEMRGVLEIFSSLPQAFSDDDIRRFEEVAAAISRRTHESPVPPPSEAPAPVEGTAAPAAEAPATVAEAIPAPAAETNASPIEPLLAPPVEEDEPEVDATAESAEPRESRASLLSRPAKLAIGTGGVIVLALAGWGLVRTLHFPAPMKAAPAVSATTPAGPAAAPVSAPVATPPVAASEAAPAETPKQALKPKTTTVILAEKPAASQEGLSMRALPAMPSPEQADAAAPPVVAPPDLEPTGDSLPDLAAPRVMPARPGQSASGLVPGRLIHRVEPVYPEIARRAHVGGVVVLNAIIRPNGQVGTVEVVSGSPLLARAAVDAVHEWRYEPFRLNGIAVQAEATIRLNFHP